ncbi:hypothetical protein KBY85_07990 [Cyanobium sp. BA5m-10]|uniref:beta strand repeat-containing protein n=1 Tax=Cyanobium sp. BA5m-10 TaxID=2823705 RepID=UPI0020CD3C17|nr:hypothetical protein [Cyanobium sp. BA5m-10]MCP9904076.1 hypothetical protein [Cyanobium sp. BA5m-10]
MPDTINSVAVDNSTINTGLDGITAAVTNATATSSATSVDGIAAANAKATEATGIQDSTITAGQNQTITATEDATVTATAGSIGVANSGANLSGTATSTDSSLDYFYSAGHGLSTGNIIRFSAATGGAGLTTTSANQYYVDVVDANTFTLRANATSVATTPIPSDPVVTGVSGVYTSLTFGTSGSYNSNSGTSALAFSTPSSNLQVGDAVLISVSGNPTPYYVISVNGASTTGYILSATPGGAPANTLTTNTYTFQTQESTASAYFTSDAGAITDTTSGTNATDVDITAGAVLNIAATANNTASATATNIESDALANANLAESVGLQNTGVTAGKEGTITVNVDGDAIASATTTGTPSTGGDATAIATAGSVIGIDDVGDYTSSISDFSFGTTATITANVGSAADRVTVSTAATTATGNSVADSELTSNIGISEGNTGVIQVGTNGTITANAFNATNASATTTKGLADADALIANASGVDMATGAKLVTGQAAVVTGTANTSSTVVASSVTAASASAAAATADSYLTETSGTEIGVVSAGTSATLTGTSTANQSVTATSVVGTANAVGTNFNSDAVEVTTFTSGTTATVTGTNTSGITAAASSTNATAISDAIATNATGVNGGTTFTAGTTASITGTDNISLSATSTSVDAASRATATNTNADGILLNTFTAGTTAAVAGTSNSTVAATATSTDKDATATALTSNATGVTTGTAAGTFTVGTSASLSGTAALIQSATAATTGINTSNSATATVGDATSGAPTQNAYGLDLSGANTTIGTSGSIGGSATTANTAAATSTLADAKANIYQDNQDGITVGAKTLTTGTTAAITANSSGTNTASATSVGADATTNIDVNVAVALAGTSAGTITSGTAAAINATASQINTATATTTSGSGSTPFTGTVASGGVITVPSADFANYANGDRVVLTEGGSGLPAGTYYIVGKATGASTYTLKLDTSSTGSGITAPTTAFSVSGDEYPATLTAATSGADATVNNDSVYGVDAGTITSGTTLTMAASATSTQTANASNVGTSGTSIKNDANATVGYQDSISGIESTKVTAGTNTTPFTATANLSGSATANTTYGDATAQTGYGSTVSGMTTDNVNTSTLDTLTIGQDAIGGVNMAATTTLLALANTVAETATATIGTNSSTSYGNDQVNISVGRDAETIYASSTNILTATAATSGTLVGADAATATIDQKAAGTFDSALTIGNDGNVTNVATSVGNARATNIGNVISTETDTASASLTLDVQGLDQNTSTIVIGADGTVASQAQASGSAFAQNVNGVATGTTTAPSNSAGAYAIADIDVYGTNLQTSSTDITIGQTGNITGLAIAGTLTSTGTLKDQILVTGTTTDGTANAVGTVNAAGIFGEGASSSASATPGNAQSLLTAGPAGGNVIGQTISGMAVLANTIGDEVNIDDASSSMIATIGGLQNVDILGGQVGTNLIKGTSTGDYDSTAISIKGDALAVGTVTGYGIYDTSGTGNITTSGNIQAISNLLNTVVASSVAGSATATATTTAVGLGNYNVTILGSGTLTANATGLAESTASSVAGRASS